MTMSLSRRNFLRGGLAGIGAAAAATALSPLIKVKKARAGTNGKRVVIVGIGGGLRMRESLAMAEGATMPNLFGTTALVGGFGVPGGTRPPPIIAQEYALTARALALPAPRAVPLHTQGTLITNLRYDGVAGHLQGHGCLLSGLYNQLENRADARLPVPTIFELHRRETNMPASDAWYVSQVGGFYRALITSGNATYGSRFAGVYLQPPGVMQPLVPIITSGKRTLNITTQNPGCRSFRGTSGTYGRYMTVLDGNTAAFSPLETNVHLSAADNAAIQGHLAEIYSDPTYDKFFPDSFGIGFQGGSAGEVDGTADATTIFHAERVLAKFRPSVMAITLLDVDTCHADFNGYLRNQQIADACVNHLWEFIQADPELKDNTTLIVLPEHGRHEQMNGSNQDSLQRSGIDHGQGDDGDRNVWMLALPTSSRTR
jgi:hypothetical protein